MMLLRGSVALLLAACALPLRVAAQTAAAAPTPPVPLVDVPYVPQSEALCGGAAVAMVLRYWGERDVHAEQFASLVVDSGEGILTTDLVSAVRARGWNPQPFRGTAAEVRAQLARGRPVIALIEDRPGRYHYVVIVAWANGHVLFHDPARAPMRVTTEAVFAAAWEKADRWALVITPGMRPGTETDTHTEKTDTGSVPSTTGTDTDKTVSVSVSGTDTGTETDTVPGPVFLVPVTLTVTVMPVTVTPVTVTPMTVTAVPVGVTGSAAAAGQNDPLLLRELAGRAFTEKRYAQAATHARELVQLAPDDAYGWQLLASALYLLGDDAAALDAWNRIGRPVNDLTRIDGLRRMRHAVVARAVDIPVGAIITDDALAQARRRVRTLPAVVAARVDYRPVAGGRAEVHAAIVEPALLPHALPDLFAHGARAALEQRIRIDVTNAFGAGDVWSGDFVWQHARRALELGVALPHAFGAKGVWHVRAGERTLTHASADAPLVRETRRTALLSVTDWASAQVRWQGGASYDEWAGRGAHGGLHAGIELRSPADRAALRADVDGWLPSSGRTFARTRVRSAVRSAQTRHGVEWDLAAGVQHAPPGAPRDVWAGAGAGLLAEAPLRAHVLYDDDGRITGRWFAPRLAHGTAEVRYWAWSVGPLRLGAGAFIDAAAVAGGPLADRTSAAVDAGLGLRAHVAGLAGGVRIDVARGLTDGASAVSIGWVEPWPAW